MQEEDTKDLLKKRIDTVQVGLHQLEKIQSKYAATGKSGQISLEAYAALFEHFNDGISIVDIETKKYLFANSALCKVLGYNPGEIIGLSITDTHPRQELPYLITGFQAMARGDVSVALNIASLTKDKKVIHTNVSSIRTRIKGKPCLIAFFTEVTDFKSKHHILSESEKHLKLIMEQSSDGINISEYDVISNKRRLVLCNERFAQMAGRTCEELMTADNINDFISFRSLKSDVSKCIENVLKEKPYRGQASWNRPDGEENYFDWVAAPTKVGDRYYVVGIDRDITETRKAEEMLRRTQETLQKSKDELENRVARRTSDLQKLNKQLRDEITIRKQAQNKLLTYQNQLRSLASELSLAEERTRRQIATDVHDHIGQNLAMAKMKIELLVESVSNEENKLLTKQVSRIIAETIDSTRTLTFEISPPVLYELGFEAAVEWLLRKSRKQHGLTTSFQTDGRNKPLDGNVRVFLFQAVRELLINVSKHSGAKKVIVSVFRLNNHVQVSVADNGKGFNMEKLNSLTPNPSGFGLFSIKERLSYIGGKLNIDSAKGKGARIIMTAPLAIEQRDTGG